MPGGEVSIPERVLEALKLDRKVHMGRIFGGCFNP